MTAKRASNRVIFRADAKQIDTLKAGAKNAGLSVSDYIRFKVFGGEEDRAIGRNDLAELGVKIDEWGGRILAELAAAVGGDDPDVGRVMRAEPDERTLGAVVEMLLLMRLDASTQSKASAARKLRELGYQVFGLDGRTGRAKRNT